MENKQTAVQWLINKIDMQYPDINVKWKEWMVDKAKEMEKEQHGKTWDDAITQFIARGFNSERTVCDFDEYYAGNYE
jgi:hypothetical protein